MTPNQSQMFDNWPKMDAEGDTTLFLKAEKYFWKHVYISNTWMCQTLNETILYSRTFCYSNNLWSNHDINLLHEDQQLEFIIHLLSSS